MPRLPDVDKRKWTGLDTFVLCIFLPLFILFGWQITGIFVAGYLLGGTTTILKYGQKKGIPWREL